MQKIRVVHAQVFADVLFDVLLDYSVTDDENEYLDNVRSFTHEIGWAP